MTFSEEPGQIIGITGAVASGCEYPYEGSISFDGKELREMELGQRMVDAMRKRPETVVIGDDGWGIFSVEDGSVSVWVTEAAGEELFLHVK